MYPDEKFHFIMGVMADKDYGEMIRELLPLALDFKTVTVESERALRRLHPGKRNPGGGVSEPCGCAAGFLKIIRRKDSGIRLTVFYRGDRSISAGKTVTWFPENLRKAASVPNHYRKVTK